MNISSNSIPNNHKFLSSDTLFHFTDNRENLISILKYEFKPHYALEDFEVTMESDGYDLTITESAIPMLSFCDIQLSNIRDHLNFYGGYGIGLKKEWGVINGINPVLYLNKDALLKKHIMGMLMWILRNKEKSAQYAFDKWREFIYYIKPYEGKQWRKGKYQDKRFYDEREWRYIPEFSWLKNCGLKEELTKKDFLNQKILNQSNASIEASEIKLAFEPDDINYLIIENEHDRSPLIKLILDDIKQKYTTDVKQILCSKIISSERIIADF